MGFCGGGIFCAGCTGRTGGHLAVAIALEGHPDPGQKFLDSKRLRNVVHRPGVQAGDLVHHSVPRRKEDHRRVLGLLEPPQDLHAAELGKHDIQKYQVIILLKGHVQGGPAVGGFVHPVTLVEELQFHEPGQLLLIFNYQNTCFHVLTSYC